MIIVIGDGRDRENDRTRVTAMGERAAKENVRIHTIGFAASGARRPLLVLGELSKKSLGTFRWVHTEKAESWQPVFAQLAAEIANQYVLTYYVPAGEFAGKKLHIATTGTFELASNEAKVPQARCGDLTCSTSQACIAGRCSTLAPGVKRQFGRAVLFAVGGFGVLIVLLAGVRALKKLATPTPAPAPTMARPMEARRLGKLIQMPSRISWPRRPNREKTMVVQIAATASSPPAGSNARPTPDRGATAAAPALGRPHRAAAGHALRLVGRAQRPARAVAQWLHDWSRPRMSLGARRPRNRIAACRKSTRWLWQQLESSTATAAAEPLLAARACAPPP